MRPSPGSEALAQTEALRAAERQREQRDAESGALAEQVAALTAAAEREGTLLKERDTRPGGGEEGVCLLGRRHLREKRLNPSPLIKVNLGP